MATLPEYHLGGLAGEENLLLVSVGTGSAAAVHRGVDRALRRRALSAQEPAGRVHERRVGDAGRRLPLAGPDALRRADRSGVRRARRRLGRRRAEPVQLPALQRQPVGDRRLSPAGSPATASRRGGGASSMRSTPSGACRSSGAGPAPTSTSSRTSRGSSRGPGRRGVDRISSANGATTAADTPRTCTGTCTASFGGEILQDVHRLLPGDGYRRASGERRNWLSTASSWRRSSEIQNIA